MNKRNVCQLATVLGGLLAIILYTRPNALTGHWPTVNPMGASLGLLSAIFGTLWVEYQKRQDTISTHSNTPAWLRRLLFGSVLLLSFFSASAQTNWTNQYQVPGQLLFDVAYGGGKYVTVGNSGLLQISTDGIAWTTQVAPSQSAGALLGIVYANGQFVAVGTSGRVITSPDGLTWSSQVSGTTKFLWSIAYGGGRFIAVGDDGIAITSTNGIAWTTLVTGTSVDFNDITYGGGEFVAVGDGGLIRTTPNGIIWTARASGTAVNLKGVTVGGNGQFVAVGSNSTVVSSPNGIGWTAQQAGGTPLFLTSVTVDPAHGLYVAVAETNLHQLLRSTDGKNWTTWSSGTQLSLQKVRYVNSQFIAVGQLDIILTSPTGINWYPRTISIDIQFNAAAYGNGHYVSVGKYPISISPSTGSVAVTSTNGINYTLGTTEHFSGAGEGFNDVVFGNGQFVAVGGEAIIQTSADGKTWTLRHALLGASLHGIAYGGGRYVAVGTGLGPGANGNFVRSTDGINWTSGSVGMNTYYYGITYVNGQFVAVGFNGAIGTSPDGSTWTSRTSGTTKLLKGVAEGKGIYVAVGLGGTVVRSTNGINWTTVPSFTPNDFNHVTFGIGQFVAVSSAGTIYTSPDGLAWTKQIAYPNGSTLSGITYGNGLFVAVGDGATVLTSPADNAVPPGNQPPVANGIPNQSGTTGQGFSYTLPANTFSDPNGDVLTVSVANLPAGLNFTAPATISGIPTAQGVSTVTVKATDPGNLSTQTTFTITINPAGNNQGAFAITGVSLVSCQSLSATQRQLVFKPQYAGLNGQPISFSVVNEMLPTTNAGPYTLGMYIDNPTIILKATQSGTAGEASFTYNWLAACGAGSPRKGAEPTASLQVRVLGNPVANGAVLVEVREAGGQALQLSLTDLRGQVVGSHQVMQADLVEQHTFEIGHQAAGLYLLRVSSPTQTQTSKILKL